MRAGAGQAVTIEGTAKEARCKYCGQIIAIVRGHRRRQFCNDRCRQAAHRAEVARREFEATKAARLAAIQQERTMLLNRHGNLLPGTLDLLLSLQSASLAEKIVNAIRAEQELVRQTELQARSDLIEYLLLTGEQIGYPRLINDDFVLEAGVDSWLTFVQEESLEQLYLARDIIYVKREAANGRKRLVQLA